jgi:hypothetical protein
MAARELTAPESCDVLETRPWREEDRPAWETTRDRQPPWHDAPPPEDPAHVVTLTVTRNGRPFMFGTGRITAELFVTVDPEGATAAEKWRAIQELLAAARVRARELGIREMHLFVPVQLQRYAERLRSLPGIHLDDRFHLFVDVVLPGTEGKT